MEATGKHFKKRQAILDCLRATTSHPSAEWVHGQLRTQYPDISLGTVYRNLALFKEQGLITSLGTVGGIERFDANTKPHVHFICSGCHRVDDLPQMEIPAAFCADAGRYTGGRADSCTLSFTGMCRECLTE